jgi:chemotaxis protein MotB
MKQFIFSGIILCLLAVSCVSGNEKDHLTSENTRLRTELLREKTLKRRLQSYIDRHIDPLREQKGFPSGTLTLSDSLWQRQESQLRKYKERVSVLEEALEDKSRRIFALEEKLGIDHPVFSGFEAQLDTALQHFRSSGLGVSSRNGNIFVSLSNQLLFESGKTDLRPQGKEAIGKIARMLKNRKDFRISVEGHTDQVPVSNLGAIKDNWDLSALRATSVVRELMARGVPGENLIAAGHAQYAPLSTEGSVEGKEKNRRTEIILRPRILD